MPAAKTGALGASRPGLLAFPGFSLSLGSTEAAAMNYLLGLFPVPPFLLPMYQAASVDFGVPWEILAAINEVETDYGRDLATSTAGAVGWMQFLPSTWLRFGMDADGRGSANPFDPVDAIFAAARYLRAAGGESSLAQAIYAYNHADWYVTSVELRARLLQYLPQGTVDGLTGLMQAIFPVAGHLGRYAPRPPRLARLGGHAAVIVAAGHGAPVVAVADSRVVDIGHSRRLGKYVVLEDSYGDRFTYIGLGSLNSVYPVLRPRVASVLRMARELQPKSPRLQSSPLPAATQLASSGGSPGPGGAVSGSTPLRPASSGETGIVPLAKERLFADPARPASYAAGGRIQVQSTLAAYAATANISVAGRGPSDYFSQTVRLTPSNFTLAPLRRGAVLASGSVIGHVGRRNGFIFQVRPGGAGAPVDPRPLIAGWELVGRLTAGHAALVGAARSSAFGGQNPSLGQLLLGTRASLQRAVLSDRRVGLDRCGKAAVRAGHVDRRVLAVIEYLSYSGLGPAVSGLGCTADPGSAPRFYISQVGGIPVAGHQQDGGVVDVTIRQLLGLHGGLRPSAIVSLRSYAMQPVAVRSTGDDARIEVQFPPAARAAIASSGRLDTAEWARLMTRLSQLNSPQP